MSEQHDVYDFHVAMGVPAPSEPAPLPMRRAALRLQLLTEEGLEACNAVASGDVLATIRELCDVLYVVYGTAVEMGVDLAPFFAEVHASNMRKAGGPVRADGKITKPEGWTPPDLARVYRERYGVEAPA
jgi:predicted HAD superfamily Cof-like phosphohydrolase